MEQPSRKGIADVVAPASAVAKAVSPSTVLELDVFSVDGTRSYKGSFKYRVPTLGTRVDIGVLRTQYQQGLGIRGEAASIAEALAYLSTTIDHASAPQWWKDSKSGIDLYDYQPLFTLYAKARAYEATFLGANVEPTADEGSSGEGPGDDGDGSVEPHVQPPAQRRQVIADLSPRSRRADSDAPGDSSDEGGGGDGSYTE